MTEGTGTNCTVDFLWCLGHRTCGCVCIKLYSARCTELSMSAWGILGLKSAAKTQRLDPTGQIVYFCHSLCCSPTPNQSQGFYFSPQFDFIVIYYIV